MGEATRLAGWVHRLRDHGGLRFVDLRDHFGITQLVFTPDTPFFEEIGKISRESVISVEGEVVQRLESSVNPSLETGEVELRVSRMDVLSRAEVLPFSVAEDDNPSETTRLTYRFLDLRRERLHRNIQMRSEIISSVRRRMVEMGFTEVQTPILTRSSPEGARDYLVPSRLYPGKFYALPQAPQMFKQLLMVSGFNRYFQIAPCFRDEAGRANRSPGEFYQIDLEMSFVEQDDVFTVVENLMCGLFGEFSDWEITAAPFPRIAYSDALLRYGTDKPDLRNPLEISDLSDLFETSDFQLFRKIVQGGGVVRCLSAPAAEKPRAFFDRLERELKQEGAKGLAWLTLTSEGAKGGIAGALGKETVQQLCQRTGAQSGSALLLVADEKATAAALAGKLRVLLGERLGLYRENTYEFCWIVDFPMYEQNPETGAVQFSHNPFSMPQGGLDTLNSKPPLEILAHQYDLVCNDLELSSGAIRNHSPEIMYRAFEIAGYSKADVDDRFGGMIKAFRFGAPPHGGLAPGLDRIIMLLTQEPNIREVVAFPMNQNAQDLLMGAPSEVLPEQLEELHLEIRKLKKA